MPRKTTKPAPPVILTAEQIEAKARRDAAADAYVAAREDLLRRAQAIAEKLHPGRVYGHSIGDCFSVMFGDPAAPRLSFAGPGVVEMIVELTTWSRPEGSNDFDPPSLRFFPRAYSLSCSEGIDGAEAQGRALIDAAAFARTILARREAAGQDLSLVAGELWALHTRLMELAETVADQAPPCDNGPSADTEGL